MILNVSSLKQGTFIISASEAQESGRGLAGWFGLPVSPKVPVSYQLSCTLRRLVWGCRSPSQLTSATVDCSPGLLPMGLLPPEQGQAPKMKA